jgi:hypothetical protein
VPIIIIVYILNMAYDAARDVASMSIADMICIAFFFDLRPGEYTGTTSDDTPFHLQDVGLYIQDRKLNLFQCSYAELNAATSVSYTFTTQKMALVMEKLSKVAVATRYVAPFGLLFAGSSIID